jgi:hypothetical protein
MLLWLRGLAIDAAVLNDVSKTLYLALLYAALRMATLDERGTRLAVQAFVAGAAVMAALGLLGAVANQLGSGSPLAFDAGAAYPYLGQVARARAFTATPNMLASIAMLALLLVLSGATGPIRGRRWVLLVLAAGFAASASKSVVALAVGLFTVWALRRPPSRRLRGAVALAWGAGFLLFGVLSHFAVVCAEPERARLERAMFIAGESLPFGRARGCAVYATNYAFNKRASVRAIRETWPFGLGPGRHPEFVARLQEQGAYPRTLWQAVPHSSYTGIPAELGLTGLLGFGILAASVASGVWRGLRQGQMNVLAIAAAGALAAVSIETLATDVMHFRHYAWLAALVAAASARTRG